MKQLVVLGGKGGTGKTTVVAALAHLLSAERPLVLADADVDAPNLALLLDPAVQATTPFTGGAQAEIDATACAACGLCAEVCRYDAVHAANGAYAVDATACEGCAACAYACPVSCIRMEPVVSGEWHRSQTRFGPFVHAHLYPGQENSGKLVSTVRQQALLLADEQAADLVLVDGSPGIGCPVIAALTGMDLALMVTEPTVSGKHDLERVLALAAHFGVQAAVCLNKADLHQGQAQEIIDFCRDRNLPLVGQVPYDESVLAAMRRGQAVTEVDDGAVARELRAMSTRLQRYLDGETLATV